MTSLELNLNGNELSNLLSYIESEENLYLTTAPGSSVDPTRETKKYKFQIESIGDITVSESVTRPNHTFAVRLVSYRSLGDEVNDIQNIYKAIKEFNSESE